MTAVIVRLCGGSNGEGESGEAIPLAFGDLDGRRSGCGLGWDDRRARKCGLRAADLGGFWGWAVFNSDGTADAELTGCGHLQGGGGGGAGHFHADVPHWYISGGDFWVVDETDTCVGHGQPVSVFTPGAQDTGIPAAPGHYNTTQLLGFSPPPGVSFNVQVTKIPNR